MNDLNPTERPMPHHHTEQTSQERAVALRRAASELGGFTVHKIAEEGEKFDLISSLEGHTPSSVRVDDGNVAISIVTAEDTTAPLYERADEMMARRA